MSAMEKAVLDDVIRRLLTDGRNRKQVKLSEAVIKQLCLDAMTIFLSQPNLLRLHAPTTICGDVHGQFQTLLKIFKVGGYPPKSTYLFLGNYVDQGTQSLETICLLLAYKVRYPDRIFLLRGNHEDAKVNRTHGFYDECKRRFNDRLWKTLTDCFNCLPVAALIEKKIFCIHAGLSPELHRPEEIDDIRRPTEIPDHGLLCDLLWSDPHPETIGWGPSERGVSCSFGRDKVEEFLYKNDLDLICRSHQVVEDGYNFFVERKFVTISSTSNYRGEFVNAGALLIIDKTLVPSFKTFHTQVARGSNPIMKRLKEALEISSSMIVSKEEMVTSDVVEKEYVDSPHISSSPSSLVCSECCASQSSLDDFVKISSVGSINKTCQTEMRESSQVFSEVENIEEHPTLPTYDIVDQASGHDACSTYDTQSIDQACPYTVHDEEILDEFMGIDLSDFSRWESESVGASTVAPVVIVPSTLADMAHHGSLAQLNNGEAAYKDALKQLRILRTVDFSSSVPVAAIHDCLVAITKALEFHGLSPSQATALLNLQSNLLPVASQVFSHCQAMKPLKEAVEAVEKQSTEWKQKKELLEERTKALKRKKEEYDAKDLELIRLQAELVRLVEEATELKASVDRDLSSVRAINDEVVVGFAELKKAKAALPTYRKQLAEEETVVEEHSRLLSLMFDMVEDL